MLYGFFYLVLICLLLCGNTYGIFKVASLDRHFLLDVFELKDMYFSNFSNVL